MCEQCTYVSLSQTSLKLHVQTVHEGIRYPCDSCNYEATQKQNLERHKRNAHGKVSKRADDGVLNSFMGE